MIESNDFFKRISFDELKKYPHVLLALLREDLRVSTIELKRPEDGRSRADEITQQRRGESYEYWFSTVIGNVFVSGQVGRFKND
jgi:hypothetical protein